jgi:hypothetical protein
MHAYGLCGVRLTSACRLSTLRPATSEATVVRYALADALSLGEIHERYSVPFTDSERPFVTVGEIARGYLVRAHGLADFVVDPSAARLTCAPKADVDPLTIEQLLVDQVVPRMLHAMRRPCLHASAVDWGAGAVAFVGASGMGKSTMSAAACEGGASLVCDDCLAVTLTPGRVMAHSGYGSVRLWPDAAMALRADADQLELATPRVGKRRAPYPMSGDVLPLRAVVRLERGDELLLEPMTGAEAMKALGDHVHRMVDDDRNALSVEFGLLSRVAERVDILRLTVPTGHEATIEAVGLLRDRLV